MLTARFPSTTPAVERARAVDQFVESVFRDFPAFGVSTRHFPPLNAWEDENSVYVEAELPGFRIEDLEITMTGNELRISGARPDHTPEEASFYRRERPSGSFSRTVKLGTDVDSAKVDATLRDGVLLVTLPKRETVKARKIEVKVA